MGQLIFENIHIFTNFGNFIYGFSSLRLWNFLNNVFRLQGETGKTKWKINKLLRNILVISSPKTTKNEVTKMGYNAHMHIAFLNILFFLFSWNVWGTVDYLQLRV